MRRFEAQQAPNALFVQHLSRPLHEELSELFRVRVRFAEPVHRLVEYVLLSVGLAPRGCVLKVVEAAVLVVELVQ